MVDILDYIIKLIVDNPQAVSILEDSDENGTLLYTIKADTADYGKIIGKEGKIIRSIRNVMKIPAIKNGKRISISLADSEPQTA